MSIGELMFFGGLIGITFSIIVFAIIKIILGIKKRKLKKTLNIEYIG